MKEIGGVLSKNRFHTTNIFTASAGLMRLRSESTLIDNVFVLCHSSHFVYYKAHYLIMYHVQCMNIPITQGSRLTNYINAMW